ncbi:hypothetical protein PSR1_03071 [Anaeromyxobacter sp. PSR-1]|nr:hypothetical protein PSR1_03071 [Anaeromyxobacter sp. PSR-1]
MFRRVLGVTPHQFAAFALDPDGNNVEAVFLA